MQVLKEGFDTAGFFARLAQASRRVLMLDYDGTLAPLRRERDRAFPYPGVRERLAALIARGHTRVVLVSGRKADEVARLAGLEPTPEIWGNHGWERLRADGRYELAELAEAAVAGLAEARAVLGDCHGDRVEVKPASVAFHLRGLPAEEAPAVGGRVQAAWEVIAARAGLELHPFDGGIELRVPGRDKGSAVEAILEESGDTAAAAYLGDDLTDEDAFRALGTRGAGVLVRPELRETAAALWLVPPEELLDFFEQWQAACQGDA